MRRAVREAASKVSADYKAGKYKSVQEAREASRRAQTEATNNAYAKFAKAAGVRYSFKWKKVMKKS